jgi:hypothetical protein
MVAPLGEFQAKSSKLQVVRAQLATLIQDYPTSTDL